MKKLILLITMVVGSQWAFASDVDLWKKSTLNKIIDRGELQVCMEVGYLPFEMRDKSGNIIGFDVDIAKAMAKTMGVKLDLRNTAWDGIIPALVTAKCDIIIGGMTITAERNLKINFSDPYIVVGQTVLLNKKHEGKIKSYKELNSKDYTITTQLGTSGDVAAKKLLSKAKLNLFETSADAALEVINNKADAFIYDLPYNTVYAAQNPGKAVLLDTPFTFEPLGFAIRKGDPDFMNFINNFLAQIKGDGTYDVLYNKWFVNQSWIDNIQ